MTTPASRVRDDGVDLEGCTANHCHRPRSRRQEGAVNEDGIRYACHQASGWGTSHVGFGACKLHGGNTDTGVVHAAQQQTETVLAKYGTPADIDPAEALLEEVQRTAGVVRYLTRLVADMDPADYTWGLSEQITEPAIVSDDGETITFKVTEKHKGGIHPLITLLQQERRHLREVARDAVAAGVSQRMVSLYESAGDVIADAYDRVLESLNLTPEQKALVPAAVVREMRMIRGETV